MATINASTLQDVQYSGDCPAAFAHGQAVLSAAQPGDKVRLVKLYAGTKVFDAKMINEALGTGTTVAIGFEYVNGEAGGSADSFITNTATTSAARVTSAVKPVMLNYDAYITATVGGAAASGALDVVIPYEFRGK